MCNYLYCLIVLVWVGEDYYWFEVPFYWSIIYWLRLLFFASYRAEAIGASLPAYLLASIAFIIHSLFS